MQGRAVLSVRRGQVTGTLVQPPALQALLPRGHRRAWGKGPAPGKLGGTSAGGRGRRFQLNPTTPRALAPTAPQPLWGNKAQSCLRSEEVPASPTAERGRRVPSPAQGQAAALTARERPRRAAGGTP